MDHQMNHNSFYSERRNYTCAAKNCKHNEQFDANVTYFRFPRDNRRATIWAIACNREDLLHDVDNLYKSHRLCGDHFESKMFVSDHGNTLKPNAVPTLFPCLEGSSSILYEHNYSTSTTTALNIKNKSPIPSDSAVDNASLICHESIPIDEPLSIICTNDSTGPADSRILNVDLSVCIRDEIDKLSPDIPTKSCVQTQTSSHLSAHSPRKEKMRELLKTLRQENARLKRKNDELEHKFKKMEECTALEQYKSLLDFAAQDPKIVKRKKINETYEEIL